MNSDQKIKDFQNIYHHYSKRIYVWEPFMKKYNCERVCEIGVRNGVNFNLMIKHGPKEAVAIDAWIDDGIIGNNDKCYLQEELDKQYNSVKNEMADKPFVKVIRKYSSEAVKYFPNEYFDFIFIDANHTEEGCYKDIIDWYPKVKKGGILAGDDYEVRNAKTKRGRIKFGVVDAVNRFVKEKNLEYFILKPIVWGIIKL